MLRKGTPSRFHLACLVFTWFPVPTSSRDTFMFPHDLCPAERLLEISTGVYTEYWPFQFAHSLLPYHLRNKLTTGSPSPGHTVPLWASCPTSPGLETRTLQPRGYRHSQSCACPNSILVLDRLPQVDCQQETGDKNDKNDKSHYRTCAMDGLGRWRSSWSIIMAANWRHWIFLKQCLADMYKIAFRPVS